ncbi:hypothetical protein PITCH_A140040 [uncultured Desulfobacterium sp.]|uniref:Uncharacterized protein n=1 Tax=uncultured Desulfobacterium sp. TaxID=201089 RepID=A0A445MSW2_9BACT|nr:hypothetical protein PITCH_A140040 [uncultured Desulfobacterium sp.]
MHMLIENTLAAFSLGQMQDFITMHRIMVENNISIERLEDLISKKKAALKDEARNQAEMPRCPECGDKLAIQPIRLPRGPRNIHGWKSLWHCTGENCLYEAYSHLTVNQEIQRRMKHDSA